MATPLRYDMTLPDGQPLRYDTPGARWDGTVEDVMAASEPQNNKPMNTNKISAAVSDADKSTALGHFQSLLTLLPFLQTLTPEQKKRIINAANGRLPFIQQACQYAQQNPGVLPGNFNLPEFVKDVTFLSQFVAILNAEENLHGKLRDTFSLANSDGYDQALKVYGFFKNANFTGEYNDIVNNLGSYFAGQGPQTNAKTGAKPADTTAK
jgi:hypothetical protein